MRKIILVLALWVGLITSANSIGAELVAPMPDIALAEAVNVEPASELVSYEVLENIKWRVRKGENLTRIAKRYAEYRGKEQLQGFIDEIEALNKAKKNPCIKNRNLVLADCIIDIPAYVAPQVRVQNVVNEAILGEWQKKAADLQTRVDNRDKLVVVFAVFFISIIVILAVALRLSMAASETRKVLEQKLAHASTNLESTNQQLASKAGVEQDNVRLRETLRKASDDAAEANGLAEMFSKCFPGAKHEFSDRTGVVIKDAYVVCKSHLEAGKPTIDFLKCLLCRAEDIKPSNAKSHYFSVHGTSQDLKPDGWTE